MQAASYNRSGIKETVLCLEDFIMKELSKAASAVRASTTLAIDAMFKQMKADGVDVIGFGAGEPDFDTPDLIKAAAVEAIRDNFTRYTPTAGIPDLRQAVCDRLRIDCNVTYAPSQVVVASGAKHALYAVLQALIDPGDEVIIPAPFWVTYFEMVRMVGGTPVVLATEETNDFKLTPEQLSSTVTDRTKAILLNNPSNPTGMVYSRDELNALANVCVDKDLYIVADEIYYRLVYDGKPFTSVAALGDAVKERTILVHGVSKSYAMTGWRIGYAAAPERIAQVMSNYLSHSTGAPCSIAQKAAVTALNAPQDTVELMRRAFEKRRDHLVERMNAIPGVGCLKPQGAFYAMMSLKELLGKKVHGVLIQDANDFSDAFLKYGLVATVPGNGFGAPEFVRWSYATSMEHIDEGLNRLEKFLTE